MQFIFDLDIQEIVAQATSTERIQPLLDKAITEALRSVIGEVMGYRSEFQTKLKEQMAAALPHGLAVDEIAKFQHVLNRAITTAVQGCNNESIQTALREVVQGVMPDVPPVIKLSELLEKARDGFHKEKHEEFFARLELSDRSSGGGGWLYLDSDSGCGSNYGARTRLSFNAEGEVYAMTMDGKTLQPLGLPNAITRFEGQLLALYVGRSRLNVDMDEGDVESACEANYD